MLSDKKIDYYFKLAKKSSELSTYKREHIGAIIVYKNRVLSTGYNTNYSHPIQYYYNKHYRSTNDRFFDAEKRENFVHAETSCILSIRHLDIDYNKCSIFIYRGNRGNSSIPLPSYCCPSCRQMLIDYGITNVYYINENGEFSYSKLKNK